MKNLLRLSALLLLASTTVLAQNDRPASDTRTDNASRNDEGREHHNYGWIGLLGLAGLAGLRRKSEIYTLNPKTHGQKKKKTTRNKKKKI